MIKVFPVSSAANPPWLSLPDEIKMNILEFVSYLYLIPLKATCHDFHRLVWTQVYPNDLVNYCSKVAVLGELEILKWARANGAPWNKWTFAYAAQGGQLAVLQWARDNGAPESNP